MTDVAQAPEDFGASEKGRMSIAGWLSERRWRPLALWAAIVGALLVGVMAAHVFWRPILETTEARAWFVAATTLLWLPLLLMQMDPPDNIARGPSLTLPVSSLFILAGLAAATLSPQSRALLTTDRGALNPATTSAFLAFMALAFAPRVANAWQYARARHTEIEARTQVQVPDDTQEEAEEIASRRREHEDAEAVSALIATVFVLSVLTIAYLAGRWSGERDLGNMAGVYIAGATIAAFALFVFLDRFSDFPPVKLLQGLSKGASKRFGWLSAIYSGVDATLVRIGSHLAGMEHRSARARYGILVVTEISLCGMAWLLPPPLGLAPAAVGFLVAFSISRLWAWVEDDRALAVITQFRPNAPLRVGFREDFRDETLLGFVFVLILIPIALMQAHTSRIFGGALFDTAVDTNYLQWLGYLGFELAKALPVVDWADIYGLSEGSDVLHATRPLGMHAVFAARAMVDLVLISSLLQAISISSRNRQQKTLYAVRQINRVDELIERRELARIVSKPETERFSKSFIDFRHYDGGRLNEILSTSHDPRIKAFVQHVLSQRKDALENPLQVLVRLANNRAPESALADAFAAVKRGYTDDSGAGTLDFSEIFESLRAVEGLKAIKVDMMEFATKLGSADEAAQLLDLILFGKGRDRFQYTRIHAAKLLRDLAAQMHDRSLVTTILENLKASSQDAFGARAAVPRALKQALADRLKELPRSA